MLRQLSRACPFCEVRLLQGQSLPSAHQARLYTQVQRERQRQGQRGGDGPRERASREGGGLRARGGQGGGFRERGSHDAGGVRERGSYNAGGARESSSRDGHSTRERGNYDTGGARERGSHDSPSTRGRGSHDAGAVRERGSRDGGSFREKGGRDGGSFRERGSYEKSHQNHERSTRDRGSPSRPAPSRGRDTPRPSRMVLSDTVAQPRRSGDKPAGNAQDPFGFLNRTQVPRGLERVREQREAHGSRRPTGRDEGKRKTRSDHPFHALKMQSSLHQVPYSNRTAVKRQLDQYDAFDKFPLAEPIQRAIADALPGLEYRNPTPAQAVAIPALLGLSKTVRTKVKAKQTGPETFLLAAETGSGKTLAYLLPTLDAIKTAEWQAKEEAEAQAAQDEAAADAVEKRDDMFAAPEPELNVAVDPARPRAIILVPSAELVTQIGAVAKSLSHVVKFRAAPISAKMSATVIRNQLFNPNGVDVVISTPPLLASIAESTPNILARVTHLVCDEADSLFDRSFKPSVTKILERANPSLKKLILCSATIPKYLDKYLAERYPDMHRLVTPNLHAVPRRVQLGVVDVNKDPYHGNKMLACADTIWQIGKSSGEYDPAEGKEAIPIKRILVFVNEREDTEEVAAYLVKKGVDALAFHRDTDPTRQAKTLASFTGSANEPEPAPPAAQPPRSESATKRTLPNTKVIVTTDLGSRGIDTVSVRHVILYDVPHTTIDFIHRLGRTGRMGRRGRGIVLLGPGDRADVVKEVREAMYRGEALI